MESKEKEAKRERERNKENRRLLQQKRNLKLL